MKKTQFIELIMTIKKTMVSFISIMFFVLLAVAIFLGIDWSVTAFKETVHSTLETQKMYDISIVYPYGFDSDVVNKINNLDYIEVAQGQNSTEAFFIYNDNRFQAKIISLTNKLDIPHKIVGNIPNKNGEIAFERFWAEKAGIKIGDTIVFEHKDNSNAYLFYNLVNEDYDSIINQEDNLASVPYLNTDTYTVTGLFETPTYINQYKVTYGVSSVNDIPNDCIAYVSSDSFDLNAFNGYQTINLRSNLLRNSLTFEDEYKNKVEDVKTLLKDDLKDFVDISNSKIVQSVNTLINKINSKIEDGQREIDDAENKLIDAQKKIDEGQKQINEGKITLQNSKLELEDARKQLDEGWAEYNSNYSIFAASKEKYDSLFNFYDGLKTTIDLYKYIYNNKSTIITTIQGIHTTYETLKLLSNIVLDDDYLLVKEVENLFDVIFTGALDDNVYEYSKKISLLIGAIKSSNSFVSFDNEISKLESLLSNPDITTEETTQINNLLTLYGYIKDIDSYLNTVLVFYELIKIPMFSDLIKEEAVIAISNILVSYNFPKLIDIVDIITEKIDSTYDLYTEWIPTITSIMDNVSEDVSVLDSLLTSVNPIISSIKTEVNNAETLLVQGKNQLLTNETKYSNGINLYKQSLVDLQNSQKEIDQAKVDLQKGRLELEDAKIEFLKAKEDANKQIKDLKKIEPIELTMLDRNVNGGVASSNVPLDMMSSIKYTMVLLFVIVGILVCYSALSRNVYDQTIQIGTKKALGFSRKEITISFLLYGCTSTILGCLVGIILARYVIEPVILNTFAKNYIVGDLIYTFNIRSSFLFVLFEMFISIITIIFACNKVLKRKAIKLLQGPDELIGKTHFYEKFAIWDKLSLFTKTIINNCMNDGRRVLSTLVGIAGTCSLMVCAVTLVTNMDDSLDYQLKHITRFNTLIYVDSNFKNAFNDINAVLDEHNLKHISTLYSSSAIKNSKGDYITGALFAFDDVKFLDLFRLAVDGKDVNVSDGIYVTKAFSQFNDVEIGDTVNYMDGSGNKHNLPVSGIFDFYLMRVQTIMNRSTYESEYNKPFVYNSIIIDRNDYSNEEINLMLKDIDGYISSFDYKDEAQTLFSSMTDSVMIIVYTFFVLAVVLAFLVLINLLIMFVDEKKKELIVLMINGYTRKTVKKYIYQDTIFLTILGIIIGIVLGVSVGFATIKTFDSDCVTIMKNINIPSYLLCGIFTAILSAISCLIALRKVEGFKLTDLNSK